MDWKLRIINLSNKLLAVFSKIVQKFKLAERILEKYPDLGMSYQGLTLLLTVVIGIALTLIVYGILINISKFTLNFLVFIKWVTLVVFIGGIILNIV